MFWTLISTGSAALTKNKILVKQINEVHQKG
jgi:hypothetical protein